MSRCRTLAVGLAVAGAALPVAPASAHRIMFGSRALKIGMHGHDVRVLQNFLSKVGVSTGVDGQFGPITKSHVKAWEGKSSLRVNGYVSRRDEAILRGQVIRGQSVLDFQPTGGSAAPVVTPVVAGGKAILGADGHGQWEDTGYDCSGSDSYALHGGGLLSQPMTSGEFESYGDPGQGAWITVYGSAGHSYMVVAGLRFDTGYHPGPSGPQWSTTMRPSAGYVARHPRGY